MAFEMFGAVFAGLFVLLLLMFSFRWCCMKLQAYNETVRELEENQHRQHSQRDPRIFIVERTPRDRNLIIYETEGSRHQSPFDDTVVKIDDLPSYEEVMAQSNQNRSNAKGTNSNRPTNPAPLP